MLQQTKMSNIKKRIRIDIQVVIDSEDRQITGFPGRH